MRPEEFLLEQEDRIQTQDGLIVRKGTIGAFLINAHIWSNPSTTATLRTATEKDIVEALPALRSLGVFDVLVVRDEALQRLIDAHLV